MGKIDIHEFDKRLKRAMKSLGVPNPISEKNSKLISKFARNCATKGLGKARITKYTGHLKKLAEELGKGFGEATKEDIEELAYWIETSDYSPWTKQDYKVTIKRFYKWLKGGDEEYPEEVKWISTALKESKKPLPEDLPTEEDIKKLVEAANNPRDRALIMILYESGGRIGEIGSMRVKDVEFESDYASVRLKGKSGDRRVLIIASSSYLSLWLEHHPNGDDPDAPLWPKFSDGEPMTYPALAKVLRTAAERADFKKRITPHRLRHARATFLANKLTEAQMDQFFGWRQGSDMPSRYVHLSGRDLDDALLGIYGLRKEEDERRMEVSSKECPRCEFKNPADAKFCSRCGLTLGIEVAMEIKAMESKLIEKLGELRDKDVMEMLEFTSKLYKLAREDPEIRKKLGELS